MKNKTKQKNKKQKKKLISEINIIISIIITNITQKKNPSLAGWRWCTPLIPALGRQRQADF
jgi:predicted nucleic acid-binding protein